MLQIDRIESIKGRQSHHRPHRPDKDGPFLLESGASTTRAKEMEQLLSSQCRGSGLGPGHYDGAQSKDACMRNAAIGTRIGSENRQGAAQLCYAQSFSRMVAQSQGNQATLAPARQTVQAGQSNGLGDPAQIGMLCFHQSEQVLPEPSAQSIGNEGASCKENASVPHSPRRKVQASCTTALPRVELPDMKQYRQRRAVKQVPCPRQLLVSASQSAMPGDWDWAAVNRTATSTFSMQDGGCNRNSRTRLRVGEPGETQLSKPKDPDGARAPPLDSGAWHSSTEQGRMPMKYELEPAVLNTITEEAAKPSSCVKNAFPAALMTASEMRSRKLARRVAEEAHAVDLRQKRWELQSAVLPLLKQEMAYDPYRLSQASH
jgi:hypothetical protein